MNDGLKKGIQRDGNENSNAGSDYKYTTWYECKQCKYFTTDLTTIQQHTTNDHRYENAKPTSPILEDFVVRTRRKQMRSIPLITKHETYHSPNKLKSTGQHENVIDMWFKCKQCTHFVPDVFALKQHMQDTHKLLCWSDVVNDILVQLQIKECVFENDEFTFAKGASKLTQNSMFTEEGNGKPEYSMGATELQSINWDVYRIRPESVTKAAMSDADNSQSDVECDDNNADNQSNKDDANVADGKSNKDDYHVPPGATEIADSDSDANDNTAKVINSNDNYIKQEYECQVASDDDYYIPVRLTVAADSDSDANYNTAEVVKTHDNCIKQECECQETADVNDDDDDGDDDNDDDDDDYLPPPGVTVAADSDSDASDNTAEVVKTHDNCIKQEYECQVTPVKGHVETHSERFHCPAFSKLEYKKKNRAGKEGAFECSKCGGRFVSKGSLKTHKWRWHSGINPKYRKLTDSSGMYQCPSCSKTYKLHRAFTRHIKERHMIKEHAFKPFVCRVCGKAFVQLNSLQGHVERIHSKNRPEKAFACDNCGKKFVNQVNLVDHFKKQHGKDSKRFDCELCGKHFSSTSSLTSHKRSIHEHIFFYKCPLCPLQFFHKSNMDSHVMLKHSKATKHGCKVCLRYFLNSATLELHLLGVHMCI